MAVGASVMILSSGAFGPPVRSDNVERLREFSFGIRSQCIRSCRWRLTRSPHSCRRTRWRTQLTCRRGSATGKVTGRLLAEATGKFHNVLNDRDAIRRRARTDTHGKKLYARAHGERNELRAQLGSARSDLARECRKVKQLTQRVEAQQARHDSHDHLLASHVIRPQRQVWSTPLLKMAYRSLLNAVGRG